MITTSEMLNRRTPEAEAFYNIKAGDFANFHEGRPVVIGRSGTGNYGTSLEYSFYGGRTWGITSFHATIAEALDAFANLPLGKDRDPQHYRILKESV